MTDLYNREREKMTRKRLREDSPRAERILWSKLRGKQLWDLKFRRQYSVGIYVIDFYCTAAKLAVEIDGETHFNERAEVRDAKRQEYIESLGIRVIRFTNLDVYNNLVNVLDEVARVSLERINVIRGADASPLLGKEGAGGGRPKNNEPLPPADPPQSPLGKGGGTAANHRL